MEKLRLLNFRRRPIDRIADQALRRENLSQDDAHRLLGSYLVEGLRVSQLQYLINGYLRTKEAAERVRYRLDDALKGDYVGAKVEAESEAEYLLDPATGEINNAHIRLARALTRLAQQAPDEGRSLGELIPIPEGLLSLNFPPQDK